MLINHRSGTNRANFKGCKLICSRLGNKCAVIAKAWPKPGIDCSNVLRSRSNCHGTHDFPGTNVFSRKAEFALSRPAAAPTDLHRELLRSGPNDSNC